MKKLNYLFYLLAIPAMAFLASCGGDDEETPTPITQSQCDTTTFPATTGKADVQLLNFTTVDGNYTVINAKAGDVLSLAIQVTKGATGYRPQKLRLFSTDCKNAKGNLVTLETQPGLEDNKTRLDLRNVDDAQIKTVLYTVPSGVNPLYLNIQVDESKNTYTYKRIKINISNSGVIDTWTATLGSNGNAAPSRLNAGSGVTFDACNTVGNIDLVDITFLNSILSPYKAYLSSNPARTATANLAVFGTLSTTATGCDSVATSTAGGQATYFKAYSASFTDASVAALSSTDVSTSDAQYVEVTAVGNVFAFLTSQGTRGLIKVESATNLASTAGSINVTVKVQR